MGAAFEFLCEFNVPSKKIVILKLAVNFETWLVATETLFLLHLQLNKNQLTLDLLVILTVNQIDVIPRMS